MIQQLNTTTARVDCHDAATEIHTQQRLAAMIQQHNTATAKTDCQDAAAKSTYRKGGLHDTA